MEVACQEDNTLVWALDRLLDEDNDKLPIAVTASLLPSVTESAEDLPDLIRAKLCLRLLDAELAAQRMDEGVLEYLHRLAACDVAPVANASVVCPSPELILLVKTELGIQTWRDLQLPVEEAEAVLNRLFAGNNTQESYARYDQLRAALRNPVLAAALVQQHPFQHVLHAATYFVSKALASMPPSLLLAIQDDVQAGRYEIGIGTKHAAGAAPALGAAPLRMAPVMASPPQRPAPPVWRRAAPAASPAAAPARAAYEEEIQPAMDGDDGGYASPRYEQAAAPRSASRGVPAALHNLGAGLADLEQQGGQDPLPEMLQHAAGAAAAAGGAPAGRQLQWNDSPAVQHPMPEMEAPRIQQHAPLAQPTPTRQQGQRAGTAQEQDEQGGGDGVKKRRPRVYWSTEEEKELIDLVKLCGRGSWLEIKQKGAAVFDSLRSAVDMKDKWRNLVKKEVITPEILHEVEMREAEIRDTLRNEKRVGRPPSFVSPKPKKRTRRASGVEEVEEVEEEVDDQVEDADAEEEEAQDRGQTEDDERDEERPRPRRSRRLHH